ncbi:Phosphatidylserine decarboxylase-related protein [Penicillium chermesinum]|uniref:Phosphatidylserine decarboxylase proenzyme 2 n=1 Tax=Penicillium chermesinum TaxID=63820 RepID=A0A9W9NHK7_9EURO|nr:Phosphatidylserine decarboxylase-related protein [Penicillium chermesinum]KAJ5220169.1 Phosphatidylserine decarboxylase-related protein [Penicillium chermesinum]
MVRLPLPTRLKSSHLVPRSTTTTPGQSRSTSPMRAPLDSKPLLLKVTVIRGRNLAAKDRGGTSDPYLIVNLGDARQSTPTIPKTLNPEWNVSFEMPVMGVPLLECICWDHDRFGKDYLGEFDIALEDIFTGGEIEQQPTWYTLKSKRAANPTRPATTKKKKKKDSNVSGEILLQFSLADPSDPTATTHDIYRKFKQLVCAEEDDSLDQIIPTAELDELDQDEDTSDETDDPSKPEVVEKRRRKLRLARLRRKSLAARAYQFSGAGTGVQGIVFMEIIKVTDLPPERNVTRTSFDMDPFVVTSLGRKTLRTPVVRHNLNPVYHEKMVFQVMRHEQSYSISFTVMDRDKFSGNDFVASANFPLQTLIKTAPEADPETNLYQFVELEEVEAPPLPAKSARAPLSSHSSSASLSKITRPALKSRNSATSISTHSVLEVASKAAPTSAPVEANQATDASSSTLQVPSTISSSLPSPTSNLVEPDVVPPPDEEGLRQYIIPLTLKNKERSSGELMLKQYDADESGRIDKIELTTMLDTLGSTLKESTIDSFFQRFSDENGSKEGDLSFDQAVMCLEDTLKALQKKNAPPTSPGRPPLGPSSVGSQEMKIPLSSSNEDLHPDDLVDERGEEHVVEIRECPLCHQPRLSKRSDADIITHIATCASRDWRQVDNLVMGGFVTSLMVATNWGANSANILVQDRITGQINEERMSVYVRLGIRLLYKGLKSRDMEKKRIRRVLRSLSIKQGRKYDDPASASQIRDFINFHQLDMSEVLLPVEEFRTFNEFFYRALKPDARPCSAPDDPRIVVSPADCRSVVFDRMTEATSIWVKGREFSIERLLGDAYPEDAPRYRNGALGVFRLAPQDYHRFHIPVDGVMGEPKTIEGEYYTVNPMAIRSALDVYGENVRVLVPIDSVAHGRVMIVCVGAMMVGSTVITRKAGEQVARAEELGYFKFGGSTLLVLFEEGVVKFDSDLADNSKGPLETLIRVGMSVSHSPEVPQFEADMAKKAENITQEDMEDAKRRIAGSVAPPDKLATAAITK